MGSNPAQGNYSFPQKLSSVEFPVNFSQFPLNLDCESICDPPWGDALLAQGIYLTDYIYIYIYIYSQLSRSLEPTAHHIYIYYTLMGKISFHKHCFCYSNVPTTGTKDPFF